MNFSNNIKNNPGEHQVWIDSIYMKFKLKKGMVSKLLDDFDLELSGTMKIHPDIIEYKRHFWYWLCDQDRKRCLEEHKLKRVGML